MNKAWRSQNRMPKNAATEERLAWRLEHQKHCRCRPMPASLQSLLGAGRRNKSMRRHEPKEVIPNKQTGLNAVMVRSGYADVTIKLVE
jgi:hypothetical protein